ncbi:MAG: class I tRNA ligase family protein, partial [Acidobacteria bacterium]|nr:class I tRNA ligase family protein [Acidobacteriota bacterium]
EHLLVDGQKMSKSLGNVYTLSDITARGFRVSALRYLLLSSHYRKQLNFTWAGMQDAENALRRLIDFLDRLDTVRGGPAHPEIVRAASAARAAFDEALSDDLNTSAGLAAMFDLVRTVNTAIDQKAIGEPDVATIRNAFAHFDKVLGVLSLRRDEDRRPPIPEEEIAAAIEARQAARRARNFAEADRIRDEMAAKGVIFEDGPQGTRWKRK